MKWSLHMAYLGISPLKILRWVPQTHFDNIFMDRMLLLAKTLKLCVILWALTYLVKKMLMV